MSVVRGADDAAFREETEKLKQKRLVNEIADPLAQIKKYASAILSLLSQAFLIMWLWNGLQPQTTPRMDYAQAFVLIFVIKWLLSQKTGWEPAGFAKSTTGQDESTSK